MEIVIAGLLVVSLFTGLITEAIKKLLDGAGKSYSSDVIAGIVAVVVAVLCIAGYCILTGTAFTASIAVYAVCLIILSWLCAMVGYDKVMQAIEQIKEQ